MTGATFDTLKFSETLREAGMPESQAKAVALAVRDAQQSADLVTNRDLREALQVFDGELRAEMQSLRTELRADMQSLRAELGADNQSLRAELGSDNLSLRAEFRALEPRLTIRLGGIVVIALGAFTALSKWIG